MSVGYQEPSYSRSATAAAARSPALSTASPMRSSTSLQSCYSDPSSDEDLRSATAFHRSHSSLSLASQKSASFSSAGPYHPYLSKRSSHPRHGSNAHGRQVPISPASAASSRPIAALALTDALSFRLACFDLRLTQSPLIRSDSLYAEQHAQRQPRHQDGIATDRPRERIRSRARLSLSPSAECIGNVCTDQVSCAYCQARYNTSEGYLVVNAGMLLGGRYAVQRVIGQGTFGTVISALDTCHDEAVAIKIIRAIPKYRRAARIEIDILERLNSMASNSTYSQYCIKLSYWFEFRHHICMAFPLLSTDLYNWLQETNFRSFSLAQIQHIGLQLFRGVSHLHSLGIIHTDLKPENVLLKSEATRPDGQLESTDIMLIDFGSAVYFSHFHGDIVSTRHYRAPEIILEIGWSFPCDIWSLGCLLVELWKGTQLYTTHDNISQLSDMEGHHGPFPAWMIQKSNISRGHGSSYFHLGQVRAQHALQSQNQRVPLAHIILPRSHQADPNAQLFYDLVRSCLQLDPAKRVSPSKAISHPFFSAQL